MIWLRSLLFYAGLIPLTLVFLQVSLICYPLPYSWCYLIVTRWSHLTLRWLQLSCDLHHRIHGRDKIPKGPAIILCKHQSAWETLALQGIFPPHVWVLKRELLWLPFLGWGLATLEPIAIDRKSTRQALQQVIEQGKKRLGQGRWVTIFPEGTRVAPGSRRRYGVGGGVLAEHSGYPVILVAHNAGLYWPRRTFKKLPGTIDVVIGPTIHPKGKSAKEIMKLAKDWIETISDQLMQQRYPTDDAGACIAQDN